MSAVVERLVRDIEELPADLVNDEIAALLAASDLLAARVSAALERVDPAADGAVTLAHWLRSRGRRSAVEASVLVKRAARVGSCPELAAAWLDGRVATGQVDAVVVRVTGPDACRCSRTTSRSWCRRWSACRCATPRRRCAGGRRYAEAVVEAPVPGAVRADGVPDDRASTGGVSCRVASTPPGCRSSDAALDAASTADADGEPVRTRGQRRADALVAVARHFLDHADVAATSRGSRPDVTVVVTLDDLERRLGRSLDGDVLDAGTVGSLLCDAGVHRVVTDGRSIPLDAGRTTRTVGHHLFAALAVRDGGCRFPGCDLRCHGARRTMSCRGSTAARRISRTSCCCAGATTTTSPTTRSGTSSCCPMRR